MLIAPFKNISVPISRINNPKKRKRETLAILSLDFLLVSCRTLSNDILYNTRKTKKEIDSINESFKSIIPSNNK